MRNLTSLLPARTSANQPLSGSHHSQAKAGSEPKPRPKRCLNEAAHKLYR